MPETYANDATTTLSGAMTNVATSLTVASAALFTEPPPFRIRVDDEILRVTAVAGTTWTVERGREGTAAAAHASGAAISHVLTAAALRRLLGFHPRNFGTFRADGVTDCTAAVQAALDEVAQTATPGMNFQSAGGGYQAGSQANGAGVVPLDEGVIMVTNLVLTHRAQLVGAGWGTVLRQIAASTGPVVKNKHDGTAHAKYWAVRNLTIHGNADGQTSATNHGIEMIGDETFNYTSTLDEDWDVHGVVDNVQVIRCKGKGIYTRGSGEHQIKGCFIRSCDDIGLHLAGYDSWTDMCSVAHSGLQGVKVDGDSNRLNMVKVWYSGRITGAAGHGLHATFDTGELSNIEAQDNTATGFFFDFANNIVGVALKADSNSRNSPGAYPGFDVYGSTGLVLQGSASNRYNAGGPTGTNSQPQTTALRIRGSSTGNLIDLVGSSGVWGTSAILSADSVTLGNRLRLGFGAAGARSITANATASVADDVILADATAGAITVILPLAATAAGRVTPLQIKRTNGGANAVIIDGNGSETIDGALTITVGTQYESYSLVSNGTAWSIV